MAKANRQTTALHFGPYSTPRVKIGQRVTCEVRGDVTIVGISSGRIQWPIGKTIRANSLVVIGDLAKALRRESPSAIRYWWGVGSDAVWKWRKALGVGETQGTTILRKLCATPEKIAMLNAAASAVADRPERRAKIAAARRGKPRPSHVAAMLRTLQTGKRPTEATRAKMSQAHKQRGTRPPKAGRTWELREDDLLRTLPPKEVAERTGRTLTAVFSRRSLLGLEDGRTRSSRRRKAGER